MQVRDLLHAEPAELAAAHRARHVVTAPVVHLDDVGAAARARLDVIGYGEETGLNWTLCGGYEESTQGISLWTETLVSAQSTPLLITDNVRMVVALVYLQSKEIILMRQISKPCAGTAGTENNSPFKKLILALNGLCSRTCLNAGNKSYLPCANQGNSARMNHY